MFNFFGISISTHLEAEHKEYPAYIQNWCFCSILAFFHSNKFSRTDSNLNC